MSFLIIQVRGKNLVEIHSQIQTEILWILQAVFRDQVHASKAIKISLQKQKDWTDAQKEEFSEIIYGIIRYWRLLWYALDKQPSVEERDLLSLLFVYQEYTKNHLFPTQKMKSDTIKAIRQRFDTASSVRVLRESIPDWIDHRGSKELGARWDSVLTALNQKPALVLRVNTLKTTRDNLVNKLEQEGVFTEPVGWCPDALRVKKKTNVFRLKSFQNGLFEVQDSASQMVSRFLDVEPEMWAVDACAGEGSKSLHLSALMQNKGRILAFDTIGWKLEELKRRARRAGVDDIETRTVDSSKAYKRLQEKVDRVLLDVPCSGLGTLRRNPGIKWSLSMVDLQRLLILQHNLLDRYAPLVKKGGKFVYATCSVFPSEGEHQIQDFLKRHHGVFRLVKEKRFWPDTDGSDGFYMALVERKT